MRTGLLDPARLEIDSAKLSKSGIIDTVAYYYGRVGFPGFIYIALEDCIVCDRGSVVNMLYDNESPCDFIPIARIDELVLNIPTKEYIQESFRATYGMAHVDGITREMEDGFWKGYNWEFAGTVGEIRIEWEK